MKKKVLIILSIIVIGALIISVFANVIVSKQRKEQEKQEALSILKKYSTIRVFLMRDIPSGDIDGIKKELEKIENVKIDRFVTKQEAFNEMKESLKEYTSVMENMEPDFFPDYFILSIETDKIEDLEKTDDILRYIRYNISEVDKIVTNDNLKMLIETYKTGGILALRLADKRLIEMEKYMNENF